MSAKRKRVPADPELLRQLDAATATGQLVEAVLSLRPAAHTKRSGAKSVPSGEEFASLAQDVLARAEQEAGVAPARVNLYRAIGSVAVTAPAGFIRTLLAKDEVVSATASQQAEDLLIRPVGSPPKNKRTSGESEA